MMRTNATIFAMVFGVFLLSHCGQPSLRGAEEQALSRFAVSFKYQKTEKKVEVYIDSLYFTSLLFDDKRYKPVLFPINDAIGRRVTRGFPFEKIAGERFDHPHHVGIWMNHGDVNGIDFWNNSDSIDEEQKSKFGSIVLQGNPSFQKGDSVGILAYDAYWNTYHGEELIREHTEYRFLGDSVLRLIDRITTLKASVDVIFEDSKEGFYGIRVRRELEQFYEAPQKQIVGSNGILIHDKTEYKKELAKGKYRSSEGVEGDEAWGTRAKWMSLSAMVEGKKLTVTIFDHPKNINYPSHWMARGYGLFAVNPLGSDVYSNGREVLNYELKKGTAITFRYRIAIISENVKDEEINQLSSNFENQY